MQIKIVEWITHQSGCQHLMSDSITNNVEQFLWSHLYEMSREGKYVERENRLVVEWALTWDWKMTENGHEGYSLGDGNVLEFYSGDGCTILINFLNIIDFFFFLNLKSGFYVR